MNKTDPRSTPAIIVPKDSAPLVIRCNDIEAEFKDGGLVVRSGTVKLTGWAKLASPEHVVEPLKTGDLIQSGSNKGWIYCETRGGTPFLVAPKDSGRMKWREAMDFADREQASLPTMRELDVMHESQNSGALRATFNEDAFSFWYWSREQGKNPTQAYCSMFDCHAGSRLSEMAMKALVRLVRPYTIT